MIKDRDFTPAKPKTISLDSLTANELGDLRHRIDEILQLDLQNLDMSKELAFSYQQAKRLYAEIQSDETIPANQKAQVLNSCTAMQRQAIKSQELVYSIERLKKIEAAILKAVATLPIDAKEAFFDLYGGFLNE
jgi:arginine/lysine/ornithine decarboxylase